MKPPADCPGLGPRHRRRFAAVMLLLLCAGLFPLLRSGHDQPSVRPAIAEKSAPAPPHQPSPVSRPSAPPVTRTMVDMTPPPGAQSDYPLGVNAEPPPGKVILTSDKPRRLAFPSVSAGSILPARVRLLEMPGGKYRRLRIEEVWANRDRTELIARHTMVGDHLLVSPADGVDAARLRVALPPGFAIRRALHSTSAFLVSFPVESDDSLPAARAALAKLSPALVKRVEPDTFVHIASIPNDPLFPEQWGLHNTGQNGGTPDADIDAPEAWDLRTDAAAFPIAVIDTGIDYTHPDLDANIWTNAGETGTDAGGGDKRSNGMDDDGNGYVDDWRGWDFANDDNNPMDDNGHGTHVAGIIGAEGNNGEGVAGVCWSCRMMPLKALTSSGGGAWSDIIDAVAYAKAMKARVGNLSFGAYGAAPEEVKTTFAAANETLWCAAAGNGEPPHNGNQTGDDLDEFHFFPACLDVGHLISVTATGRNDALAAFANYGKFMVDIAAPGVAIRSSLPGGGYGLSSGTSMSCAYVTGFCALAWPLRVDPYPINVRQLVLTTVKRSEALRNKLVTRGRLDASLFLTIAKSRMEWQMIAWGVDNEPVDGDESLGHCLQIRPDGTVMAWGNAGMATGSSNGTAYLTTPVEIPLPTDARSVVATATECFALLSDGTVWTWTKGVAPHRGPISDVRFMLRGYYTYDGSGIEALKNGGTVWHLEHDHYSQIPIPGRIVQMGRGSYLDDSGRLYAPRYGNPINIPVANAPFFERITDVGCAILAVAAGGEVWGIGDKAALGLPYEPADPNANIQTPIRLSHWDGYLNAWGGADGGTYVSMPGGKVLYAGPLYGNYLGTSPIPPPTAGPPYEVGGIRHVVGFTGLDNKEERAYALDKYGQIFRWDMEDYRPEFSPITPVREFSGHQISGVCLANGVSEGLMLLAADFRGLYYGFNLRGISGAGVDLVIKRPIELLALRGAKQLWSLNKLWAIMPDDLLHTWGGRDLYVPTESGYNDNVIIPKPAATGVRDMAYDFCIKEDGAGWWGSLFIMDDGTLWQMQLNGFPRLTGYIRIPTSSPAVRFISNSTRVVLGDGRTIQRKEGSGEFMPVSDDFVDITYGAALKADGTLWVTRDGVYSQVPEVSGITQIDGWVSPLSPRSFDILIALRNDGRVFVMGWLGSGPSVGSLLGNGQVYPSVSSPVMVEGLSDIVQVAAGTGLNFVALRADGEVFTWGNNDIGQLGTGDINSHLFIEQPYGLSGVVQMWVNGGSAIAKRSDGSFWGWGVDKLGSTIIYGAPNLAYGYSGTVFNAGNGFEDWLTTYFNETELRDIELFADVKDPDDDGLSNLVEYALGTNPRKRTVEFTYTDQPLPEPTLALEYTKFVPSARLEKVRRNYYSNGVGISAGGTPDVETSHLVMTVPRAERRSDVDYIVEVSDDLEHWHFGPGHTVEVLNTLTNLVVYDARPMEENRKRFIRLRLVRNNPGQTSILR